MQTHGFPPFPTCGNLQSAPAGCTQSRALKPTNRLLLNFDFGRSGRFFQLSESLFGRNVPGTINHQKHRLAKSPR